MPIINCFDDKIFYRFFFFLYFMFEVETWNDEIQIPTLCCGRYLLGIWKQCMYNLLLSKKWFLALVQFVFTIINLEIMH